MQNFLSNLKAVFFYATPHSGSQAIEDLAKQIPEDSRNQMLTLMSVLGTDMARINSEFSTYRSEIFHHRVLLRFKTYGIVPTSLTNQLQRERRDWKLARFDPITKLGEKVYKEVSKIRQLEDLRIFNAQRPVLEPYGRSGWSGSQNLQAWFMMAVEHRRLRELEDLRIFNAQRQVLEPSSWSERFLSQPPGIKALRKGKFRQVFL
ncbi:hypothetical protein AXG93_1405s1060 [Marchantia polymorpha subsp. ruderalis]|uniref:Uncharacterized protein n=1 Tax=Marchantia polymorpha subsp. ruderalis TaxID=1480154 RepID=A0A176VPR5_MARPO|nr:hypothetical protein AXG93_1405s1060 [Marchantia polymorpha subsp. ruderalis]